MNEEEVSLRTKVTGVATVSYDGDSGSLGQVGVRVTHGVRDKG